MKKSGKTLRKIISHNITFFTEKKITLNICKYCQLRFLDCDRFGIFFVFLSYFGNLFLTNLISTR